MATYAQIRKEAIEADNAWQAELVKRFGKRAGDVRYTKEGKGEEGSNLRRAYENWSECNAALSAYHMSTEACGS